MPYFLFLGRYKDLDYCSDLVAVGALRIASLYSLGAGLNPNVFTANGVVRHLDLDRHRRHC